MDILFWQDNIKRFPLLDALSNNFPTVKSEILNHIKHPEVLQDYPNYPVMFDKMIYEKYWKAAPCSVFKEEHVELNGTPELKNFLSYLTDKFRSNCPTTYSLIKEYEDNGHLTNSFISRLLPGTIINPHQGWSQKYMRIHLGLVCDPECAITVGNQTQVWEEGKFLAFRDQDMHSVKHKGTKERIVYSFDISLKYLAQFIDI